MNGQFDLGAITPARYFFGIAVVVGLLLGFTSSEDDGINLLLRLVQWQLQAVGIMGCLVLAQLLLLRWPRFERRNPWLQLAASGVLGCLVFAPVGVLIDTWLGGESISESWILEVADEFSGLAPPAIILWVAINAPWLLGFRIEGRSTPEQEVIPEDVASEPRQPHFFELLPEEVRATVLYLQAELHYITVVTERGRSLILYNLRDAIEEMEAQGVAGFQSHRSFWVASAAVVELRRAGRQGELRLANGDGVPVSRRNMDEVTARLGA